MRKRDVLMAGVRSICGVLALTLLSPSLAGGDWPLYRGPGGNGLSTESIRTNWAERVPTPIWKVPLGAGFSSFTISSGRAFTLVRRQIEGDDLEVCIALDTETGTELWAVPVGPAGYQQEASSGGLGGCCDGPRSTPVTDGTRVYVLAARMTLHCLDATTGAGIWSRNLVTEDGARILQWQSAASPLIEGNLVIVDRNAPGKGVVALDKTDGSVVWEGPADGATHATPVAATIHGVRQIVFFANTGLVSVSAADGAVLWRHTYAGSDWAKCASATVAGDIVVCSLAYGYGAGAVRITESGGAFTATSLWRTSAQFQLHWSTAVYHDGFLYGLHGHNALGTAPLQCIDALTGARKWSEPGFGQGGLLVVDNRLLVLSDHGELVLVEPRPTAYTEIARVAAVTGKCWNTPAISNGRIYARSTQEAVALDLSVAVERLVLAYEPQTPATIAADGFRFSVRQAPAGTYVIEAAFDLADWTELETILHTQGDLEVADRNAAGQAARYYRVRQGSASP